MRIQFLKKEKNFKKSTSRLKPNLFWKLSIFIVLIVFIFSSFFGYRLFRKIDKEPVISTGGSSGQVETVKKERISKALEYFSEREIKSNQILNSPAPVVDPSL